jgi:hypothetical protein
LKQESDRERIVKTSSLGVAARARSNPPNTAELRSILLRDFCETAYPDLDPDPYYPRIATARRKFGIEVLCSWLADIMRELTGTVPSRT